MPARFLDRLFKRTAPSPHETSDDGQSLSASAAYRAALARAPDDWKSLKAIAESALQNGELAQAVELFDDLIGRAPGDPELYYKRANAHSRLGRAELAVADYDRAIGLRPDYANAYCNRGAALAALNRSDEALASYERALALNPGDYFAYFNQAAVFKGKSQLEDALRSYDSAIALKQDYLEAFVNRGHLLQELGRHDAAVASYERALQLAPDFAKAHFGRGSALLALKRFAAAIDCFVRASESTEDNKYLLGLRRHAQMHICDWHDLETDLERMSSGLMAGDQISAPLAVLALFDSPPLQRLAAEAWVSAECPPDDSLGPIPVRAPGDKIRVGYFSADFRLHPVSLLMAEFFERHDRSRFEVIAFAFGPKTRDEMTNRLAGVFDRFIDVDDRTDAEIALLAREIGIDIAVDLGGFTDQNRSKVFALRASPIQISYIGYLGTMGASYMDYLVADQIVIPVEQREHYAEKIIYLPSYQATDSRRPEPRRALTREDLGLPSSGFVFCCFNSNYKIMPTTFSVWMRVLARVPGSTMFLYVDNDTAQRNLTIAAERRGVDPGRLIFGKRLALEDYLARFRAMDLFLDTLPYNAGTTASDALWAGLPVLTCKGHSIAARVAASVLTAIGVPELTVSTYEEYEELAVRLALDPAELGRIRRTIADNRKSAPLFDCARFTRAMEQAFSRIYECSQSGSPPEDIFVEP